MKIKILIALCALGLIGFVVLIIVQSTRSNNNSNSGKNWCRVILQFYMHFICWELFIHFISFKDYTSFI